MSVIIAIEQLAESCTAKELEKLAHKFLSKVENEKKSLKQKRQEWKAEYTDYFNKKRSRGARA